ncbi:signal recognition particle-docking protein FtsY [Candidatus Micrarchaeota archaeon]|nr:signal recognition particle-docking protein FtsY [Candidatus Micrarchaeota archaeon]
MFDLLKKKLSGFVESLTKKESEKKPEDSPEFPPKIAETDVKPGFGVKEIEETVEERLEEKPVVEERKEIHIGLVEKKDDVLKDLVERVEKREGEEKEIEKGIEETTARIEQLGRSKAAEDLKAERLFEPKLSLATKLKGLLSPVVTIQERDCAELFRELETSLLESDVSLSTAELLINDLKKRVVGKSISKSALSAEIRKEVALSLYEIVDGNLRNNLFEKVEEMKRAGEPLVILFVGPNGMGKTTTISKLAFLLKEREYSCVLAASDTFRAAALEQIEFHAQKLGVELIKHKYGADPAAVAFDAIAHAKAKGINVVLIDTAGRQETSHNLVKEMEKIVRVVKPHFRIFVGEAIAGHSLVDQVKKFNDAIGLDGIILTKMDCDAKGGSALTIVQETGISILFIGTGQGYSDFREFEPKWFVDAIIS